MRKNNKNTHSDSSINGLNGAFRQAGFKGKNRRQGDQKKKVQIKATEQIGNPEPRFFTSEQVISFLRGRAKPSDSMKKMIEEFFKEEENAPLRRHTFLKALESFASMEIEEDAFGALYAVTERNEDDVAKGYQLYDIRNVTKITYTTAGLPPKDAPAGATGKKRRHIFERVGEDKFLVSEVPVS